MMRRSLGILVLQTCFVLAARATCITSGNPAAQICADYPANPIQVEIGQSFAIPLHYVNGTDVDITFETVVQGNIVFPGNHSIFSTTLPPHSDMTFPAYMIPTDGSMAVGTDHMVIGWGATGNGYGVSSQATFEIDLLLPQVLKDVIQLPVRWCVIEGSPQAQGHHAGELMDGAEVFRILQQANDKVWTPSAQIMFFSVMADGIPVICDPDPPPAGPGKLGDINDDQGSGIVTKPGNSCARAWERIAPSQPGRIVVNAREFKNSGLTLGITNAPSGSFFTDSVCKHPRTISVAQEEFLEQTSLVDKAQYGVDNYPTSDPALVLAHELGHQLFLGHGNGLDDNHDGTLPPTVGPRRYDEFCDPLCLVPGAHCANEPLEDPPHTTCDASSLMYYVAGCSALRPLQAETAREGAMVAPGAILNGVVNPGDGHLEYGADACAGLTLTSPRLLLEGAGMTGSPDGATSAFYYEIPGELPSGSLTDYATFADLDNDPSTGCAPAQLGFPTQFSGAEIVSAVTVDQSLPLARNPALPPAPQTVSTSVWRCDGGAFTLLSDPRIQAGLSQRSLRGHLTSAAQLLTLDLPNDLWGPAGTNMRLLAMARDLGGSGRVERTPDADTGANVSLAVAPQPQCALTRVLVNPGGQTSASASGLKANAAVDAYVGGELAGSGATDGGGHVQLDVFVPADSPQGVRPVMLVNPGTAVSALCPLLIGGAAVTPSTSATVTPPPAGSGWNNSNVLVTLSAVDAPGGPGVREIDYSASGAQTIPPVASPGAAALVTISAEGTTTLSYGATNDDNVTEHPRSLDVRLDKTPPSITGSRTPGPNAYGWNNTDVTADFQCSDALSGLLSCEDAKIVSTEGANQSAVGAAQDLALNSASFVVDGISIDKTPPAVVYTGNAGTYTVDLSVSIQCSATDALSGIVSSTCADIAGPAYTFGLGTHTYNASAVDRADNVGTGSATFVVRVTYASLCSLGGQFAAKPGLARALCAKLSAAEAAESRGDTRARAGALAAYRHQVAAQNRKSLTPAQAQVLTDLSVALEAETVIAGPGFSVNW